MTFLKIYGKYYVSYYFIIYNRYIRIAYIRFSLVFSVNQQFTRALNYLEVLHKYRHFVCKIKKL